MAKRVRDASYVNGIVDGPEGPEGMPEAVQVNGESKSSLGAAAHGCVKRITTHWPPPV